MSSSRRVFSWLLRAALAVLALAAPGAEAWAAGAPAQAPAPTPVYLDNRGDALAVLNSYINAINRKEYARAYGYWESGSSVGSFANFQAGFASTNSVALSTGTVGSSAGAGQLYYVVPVTLTSLQTNATTQTFVGCYTLHLARPEIQAQPPFQPLGITKASVQQVANDADTTALMAQSCR